MINCTRPLVTVLCLVVFSSNASQLAAAEPDALEGLSYLGEEGCPDGFKSASCIMTFEVKGQAAKMLFDGMRAKAIREECTGGMQKTDGKGLSCIKSDDGTYNCDFGYHFAKKSFGGSAVSC